MVAVKEFNFDEQQYAATTEDGIVKSLKRFNEKYKMWVTVNFVGDSTEAEQQLLEMLKREFILKQTKDSGVEIT